MRYNFPLFPQHSALAALPPWSIEKVPRGTRRWWNENRLLFTMGEKQFYDLLQNILCSNLWFFLNNNIIFSYFYLSLTDSDVRFLLISSSFLEIKTLKNSLATNDGKKFINKNLTSCYLFLRRNYTDIDKDSIWSGIVLVRICGRSEKSMNTDSTLGHFTPQPANTLPPVNEFYLKRLAAMGKGWRPSEWKVKYAWNASWRNRQILNVFISR